MTSTPRHRERGAFALRTAVLVGYNTDGTQTQSLTTALQGTREWMIDSVTRPFIPGVTIANTQMSRLQETRTCTPASGQQRFTNPNSTGVIQFTGEQYVDHEADFGTLTRSTSNYDYSSLISAACTRALARVQKPEVAGLVVLKEAKETLNSLLHPLSGIVDFLANNLPKKKHKGRKNRRNNRVRSAKDLADQHLTILFGILPFIDDVQKTLAALSTLEPVPVRFTARGEQSSVDSKSINAETRLYNDSNTYVMGYKNVKVTRTVTVRAYQLYEASVELSGALGLDLQNLPKAVWQTLPLSFVVDWFVNLGDVISALTPKAGINWVASGYTVTFVDACEAAYSNKAFIQPGVQYGWTGGYTGGSQTRVTVAKSRVPCDLASSIGLKLRSNMHRDVLDTYKVTASISLITQRLASYLKD